MRNGKGCRMSHRPSKIRYWCLIAAATLLPFLANPREPQAAALGSLACLGCVLLYIRSDRERVIRQNAERSRREGVCVCCGYSLTGNVSGVCPECGIKIQ